MKRFISALLAAISPCACATPLIVGEASYYSDGYIGRKMANKERYDPHKYTCASWDFPLGAKLLVQYVARSGFNRSVVVTNTDRGPSRVLVRRNRVIDLSYDAFRVLESPAAGVITVSVQEVR